MILFLILIFALFLRLFKLGQLPAGFTPDEASQAYSAYSLLQTGKDEWGIRWPLSSFKSFLDHKAPLQTYLMVPSISVFGLNEFATRLPSALFGVLAVYTIYLLSSKLFSKEVGLIATFVLSISPWHLQFSRMALEANLLSFLFPIGLYLFLLGLEKNKYFFYTAFFWGLSLYSYHSAKIFIPLFLLGLSYLYAKQLKIKNLLFPLFFFFLLIFPQVIGTFWSQSSSRGSDLLVTNLDHNQRDEIYRAIAYSSYRTPAFFLEKVLHNKYTFAFDKFVENYFSYFSPTFWFTEGGRETTYSIIPGRGLLYLWQLPFVLIALISLQKTKNKHLSLLILWFFLAAIPAAITKEGYRPNRAGSYAVLLEMLTAYGLWWTYLGQKTYQKFFLPLLLVIAISFFVYQEDYYSTSITKFPNSMSNGWREAIVYLRQHEKNYQEISINKGSQSQSFVAFYMPIPPVQFQSASVTLSEEIAKDQSIHYLDQINKYSIGKYSFSKLNWPEDINKNTLYLSAPDSTLPIGRRTLHRVESGGVLLLEIFDFNK